MYSSSRFQLLVLSHGAVMSMANITDKQVLREVQKEIVRRGSLDMSRVAVSSLGGYVELSGLISRMKTAKNVDIKKELEIIKDILLRKPGVRGVIMRYLRYS